MAKNFKTQETARGPHLAVEGRWSSFRGRLPPALGSARVCEGGSTEEHCFKTFGMQQTLWISTRKNCFTFCNVALYYFVGLNQDIITQGKSMFYIINYKAYLQISPWSNSWTKLGKLYHHLAWSRTSPLKVGYPPANFQKGVENPPFLHHFPKTIRCSGFHIFFPSFQPPIVGCFRQSSAAPCRTEKLRSSAPYDLQGFKQLLASFSLGLRSFRSETQDVSGCQKRLVENGLPPKSRKK